jgi:hypothetical protein
MWRKKMDSKQIIAVAKECGVTVRNDRNMGKADYFSFHASLPVMEKFVAKVEELTQQGGTDEGA